MRAVVQEYYHYIPIVRNFSHPVYGDNMAVVGTDYDLHENVYDGGDHVYWTLSKYNSPSDFVEVDTHNHTPSGTYSLSFAPSEDEDYAQFTRATLLDTTNYIAIYFAIYITSWGVDSNLTASLWNGGTQVGNDVHVKPYISPGQVNTWQNVAMALSAFNIDGSDIDAIRITVSGNSEAPNGYIDDIQVVGNSTPVTPTIFSIQPQENEDLIIESLHYTFSDVADLTGATGNYLALDPEAFTTIPALPNGILFRRYSEGQLLFTSVWQCTADIMHSPGAVLTNIVSNGTNAFLNMIFNYPNGGTLLRWRNNDKLEIAVVDDLSALTRMRVAIGGKLRVPHSQASI